MIIPGTFLGGLVRSFSSSLGLGLGSPSQLNLQLVDDPVQGLFVQLPKVGTPLSFQFYGFTFRGLLQKAETGRGTEGNPVYSVVLSDPREILEGTQVITGGYSGSVGNVPNLLNPYGYWESVGYGVSGANDSGMTWRQVAVAIRAMVNAPRPVAYGGPLVFANQTYGLDLDDMPIPPEYYRVGGGVSSSLLEIIDQVCKDCGCDFFVELVGFTIKIRAVSRFRQPPLGTLSALANSNWGSSLIRSTVGLEMRNELTSAFLVGGEVHTMWSSIAIRNFWGYDPAGNPILSTPYVEMFNDAAGKPLQQINTEIVNLNASPVADILGNVRYLCTTLEMRMAQVNYESWALYLRRHRPIMADIIGVSSPFLNMGGANQAPVRANFVNDEWKEVLLAVNNAVQGDIHAKCMRMYEFVRGYADEFMGRKYLVGLPFILVQTDSETRRVTTSYEVADAGYFDETAAPLGLSPLNEDMLRNPDGRFRAFVAYSNLAGVDFSRISPQGAVLENNTLYLEVQVDPRMVSAPEPCVVVSLSGPVVEQSPDNVGNLDIVAAVLQMNPQQAQKRLQQAPIPIKVSAAVRHPTVACIPLKSNTSFYGPWFASGAPGKVRMEQDPSLTPWNYGGHALMNLAGQARVLQAITNMQVSETGTMELVGPPTTSLGNLLEAGGPNITSIDVQCGTQGVTTSYRFQTFTPRFGVLSKAFIERMRQNSLANMELRRAMRLALKEQVRQNIALGNAARGARVWMERQAKARKRETPHDCLLSHGFWDSDTQAYRQNTFTATFEECVSLCNATNTELFKNTAIMSLDGLFRPFSAGGYQGSMPRLQNQLINGVIPGVAQLNPWKQANDIEVYTWGESYRGLHAFRRGATPTSARVFGLRAPVVLVGWGFGLDGKCIPGSGDGTTFDHDHTYRQDKWKAGPLDPLWDDMRGVWTCHGTLKGRIYHDVPPQGSGLMVVRAGGAYDGDNTNYTSLTVWNWFGTAVNAPTKVIVSYIPTDNKWYIVAADCPG
jgi:hypothetical protein